jgi:hypothetical protein
MLRCGFYVSKNLNRTFGLWEDKTGAFWCQIKLVGFVTYLPAPSLSFCRFMKVYENSAEYPSREAAISGEFS